MMAGQFCEKTTVTNKRSKNSKCSRTCFPLAILHPYGFAQVHTLQTLMHRLMSIPAAAQHTGERPRGTPACAHTHTHTFYMLPVAPRLPLPLRLSWRWSLLATYQEEFTHSPQPHQTHKHSSQPRLPFPPHPLILLPPIDVY